ncbi:glycosyltransferase family 2 protein [Alicyclobacillus fastidiosus]|uniref:Glycosyltransferase family 2 protein n=1 Tax=Alicyclobacillus fastidiosus TaxID=392011 RepID=A0ABY6ZG14_9BACL|nr:glycosyltransferase family 2 protein [Alicyclobacillus fastidiosus]WAH41776.1 glycosyltransferase family 2 protein [Alicyclobacillus fastidiosus]
MARRIVSYEVSDLTMTQGKHSESQRPLVDEHVRISVVVPVYNEEEVIVQTYSRLKDVMETLGDTYELLFVNDGSRDQTATILRGICRADDRVKLINFSRNFGHQLAITAGMDHAAGDAVVVIDGDLQDPPELIPVMVEKWQQGYQVVYAKRMERKGETRFKKWSASIFYRVLHRLTDVEIPVDTGDFRLIDRKVCDVLSSMKEQHRFIRGMVSWSGFRQIAVEYSRDSRQAGKTKYSMKKMLRLSLDGITSFSHVPMKLAGYLGLVSFLAGMVYLLAVLIVQHAASSVDILTFVALVLGGVILICMGVLGEYIGRIYDEVMDRPLYLIDSREGFMKRGANCD